MATEDAVNAKAALRRIIEQLTEEEAQDLLDYLNLQADPDTHTEEEKARVLEGEAQIARGECVSDEELRKKLGW